MQHLGAAARNFLRLVVVERLEQPGARNGARVGREHAGHVRPDLQATRPSSGEVAARRIRSATAEQYGIAGGVARNEALPDQDLAGVRQPLLQ
jgi:hypothetical protein